MISAPLESVGIDLNAFKSGFATITATYSSSPADLTAAFELITTGSVQVDRLITHRVSLESLARGVDLMRRREALKVYVTP